MHLQDAMKRAIKPHVLPSGRRPRRVRHGVARGAVFLLDRQSDLQREWGLYESDCQRIYRRHIKRDSVIVDVGAADGYSALGFASLAASGRVIAFEPDQDAAALFRRNMELNPGLARRVVLVPSAAGVASHETLALDDYLQHHGIRADFVKIDVEGAEAAVLSGAARLLRDERPDLLVEVHSPAAEAECSTLLIAAGYSCETVNAAWWRVLYPEWRPATHNRWLFACACT